jgi:L-cysteine:1D-myo-inositol 2-amino-2-deoxy-alpha-D-glucopyranoside ligase
MLYLFNNLTQMREPFVPRDRAASVYVCGITPYDTTHLGHAFTYTSFDILVRYLEWQGIAVRYVQNVTDVDDDILRKAREAGEDWRVLGDRWVRRYIDDMEALNVRPPDVYPRASEAVGEMVKVIERLVERGFAYVRGGSVYYRSRLAPFGALSRLPPGEWLRVACERGNIPTDPNKESPLDFVLWQAQAPGEPAWPSPWGPGRPGWHIECSTLSALYLGPRVDIHGGGADLAFPHHECEVAQAEAYTAQAPFARYWLHTGMLYHQGAKMSKSLGNLVMVSELLRVYGANALRLYLGSHHYREPWHHEEQELLRAVAMAERWEKANGGEGVAVDPSIVRACQARFLAAMDHDLATPKAVRALDGLAEAMLASGREADRLGPAQATLRDLAGIMGLRLGHAGPEPRVIHGWRAHKARFRAGQ